MADRKKYFSYPLTMQMLLRTSIAYATLCVAAVPCLAVDGGFAERTTTAQNVDKRSLSASQETEVHVRLHAPVPTEGAKSGWSMSIQIGENRFYHLDTLSNTTLDLGQIESGSNTFRFYEMKNYTVNTEGRHVQSNKAQSCSGSFVAATDRDLKISIKTDAHGLVCTIR
jgi:hypothetical protein